MLTWYLGQPSALHRCLLIQRNGLHRVAAILHRSPGDQTPPLCLSSLRWSQGQLAMPQSPRDVLETMTVLYGRLAFREHCVPCSASVRLEKNNHDSQAHNPQTASRPSSSRIASAATERTGTGKSKAGDIVEVGGQARCVHRDRPSTQEVNGWGIDQTGRS